MSNQPDKLRRTINRYLDDEASETETAWLAARLGASSRDLDDFVEHLLIEAELLQHGEGAVMAARPQWRRFLDWSRSPAVASIAAALVLVIAVAGILWMMIAPAPRPVAEWRGSPGHKTTVTGEVDHGQLEIGSEMRVSQGFVEITLTEGVRCIVQAPAVFRLERANRVKFTDGIAWFRVEPDARGFEVRTEGVSVVDLGTDFGIDARRKFQTEIHVFEGAVEVSSLGGRKEKTRLGAGEAVALQAAGRLEALPPDPARFDRNLPGGLPALHFAFDGDAQARWPGGGSIGQRDAVWMRTSNDEPAERSDGRFGSALRLNGSCVAVTNWPGIAASHPRTIAFWVRIGPTATPPNFPLVGWGNFTNPDRMGDFGIRLAGESGKLRIVSGRRWLEADRPVADGTWHHVAVTLGGQRQGAWPEIRLYLNGREESLHPGEPWKHSFAPLDTFSTQTNHPGSQPLTIGRFQSGERPGLPDLIGELDELIIIEGAATEEQIQAIHQGHLDDAGLELEK